MVSPAGTSRKIPLWKLIGGGWVHCVVPVYALALGADGWRFAARGGGDLAAWLGHVPGFSLWFLGLYAALGVGAAGVAALLAPARGAVAVADPLRDALAQGRGAFGPQADAALDRIAALPLDPGDEAAARMLRDLAAMVAAGRAALAGAGAGDAPMRAMTAEAIGHIARELEEHASAGAQQATERAQVLARYVGQRYGQDEI